MLNFAGKLAVVTGGGSGIGRELARQLAAQGCHVAMCDVSAASMAETRDLCTKPALPARIRVTSHVADVSDEHQVLRFRDALARDHDTDKVHLLFNNAGIGGGGSLFSNSRAQWEKTFNICWGGVYLCTRAFLPMLVTADEAHIVNTSSVNGFWASLGPNVPHTAYCAAKFAVKGFTEALMADLQVNAPHVKCSVVMPGHIGTSIVSNSRRVQYATESDVMSAEELAHMRVRLAASGRDLSQVSDADLQALALERARQFLENAPTSAASAAAIILDGVKAGRWRILVGTDAHELDAMVRQAPEEAYDPAFFEKFLAKSGWRVGR
jgi:NAD(P)-dependent dehydrogenase (short-subunit alcohol dehydrogenase family)